MSSNSFCNHTRDKQIGLPFRGRPILLITRMVADTQSCYYYVSPYNKFLSKFACSGAILGGIDPRSFLYCHD